MYNSSGIVLAEKPSFGVEPTRYYDASRFRNHGVHTGVTPVQLPSGLWVRYFDGNDKIVLSLISAVTTGGNYGISGWVNPDALSGHQMIFVNVVGASDRNAVLFIDDKLVGEFYDGGYTSKHGILASAGAWYQFLFANKAGTLSMYIQGAAQALTGAITSPGGTPGCTIGTTPEDSKSLTGYIGLLKVHNYAPSAGQAKNIFEKQRHWFGV